MRNTTLTKAQILHLFKTEGGVIHKFLNRKTRRKLLGYDMPNTGNRKITKARKKTYMIIRGPKEEWISKSGIVHKKPGKVLKLIHVVNLTR